MSEAGPAPTQAMLLAVLLRRGLRHPGRLIVVLVVGGDALQAADRDRLGLSPLVLLDAAAPAGGLAGTVAGAAEDSGEDVRLPVDHVGVAVAALRRSAGCIREPGCGPGRPTGNRRLCEVRGCTDVTSVSKLFPSTRTPPFFISRHRAGVILRVSLTAVKRLCIQLLGPLARAS